MSRSESSLCKNFRSSGGLSHVSLIVFRISTQNLVPNVGHDSPDIAPQGPAFGCFGRTQRACSHCGRKLEVKLQIMLWSSKLFNIYHDGMKPYMIEKTQDVTGISNIAFGELLNVTNVKKWAHERKFWSDCLCQTVFWPIKYPLSTHRSQEVYPKVTVSLLATYNAMEWLDEVIEMFYSPAPSEKLENWINLGLVPSTGFINS